MSSVVVSNGNENLMRPRIWTIRIDVSGSAMTAQVEGDGCTIQVEGNRQTIYWNSIGKYDPLVVLERNEGSLITVGGHVCPIYARQIDGVMWFSNVASQLMRHGDILTVDAFVLLQNLTGIPYPQNNIFKDIELLEASANYRITFDGITRTGSVLAKTSVMSPDDVLDIALQQWDTHFASGADIAVLLSGGYDSRFNLAIACNAAKRYGNRVCAFHEHKNDAEESIAIAVAEAAGIPLTIHGRNAFVGADRPVIFDPSFVDLQSGFYRENLMRWHAYLTHIQSLMPGCVIMGLGAEAHKGKYYRKIKSIEKDSRFVFGIDPIMVAGLGRKLKLHHHDHESQERYFECLTRHAHEFESFSAQVDYIHYQTYIAQGYGHRCHDLQQYFGMPFPFLDNAFLAAVFALPQEQKEEFLLVRRGINRLMPVLESIPYTSANEKSLEAAKSLSIMHAMRRLIRMVGPVYYDWFQPRRKGRVELAAAEKTHLEDTITRSALTRTLIDQAMRGVKKIPFLHIDYLVQSCLYLEHIERRFGVICEIDGGRR